MRGVPCIERRLRFPGVQGVLFDPILDAMPVRLGRTKPAEVGALKGATTVTRSA